MKDGLVDGMSLRDSFILYGETEVWQMDYVGGAFLFNFRKLYDNTSIMSANCVAEVDGVHYVFGRNDIYAHDGVTKRSILHGVNKDFVFSGLLQQLRELCFVTVDTRLNEIHFCYPSQDHLVGFLDPTTGCNRAAVYNYQLQTWTFYDLPNVVASAPSTVSTTDTFTSVPDVTYDDMGGSFIGSEGLTQQYTVYAGLGDATQGLTASRLYGLDRITGGTLAKPIATEAIKDAFLERVGIDLDEDGLELTQYKCVQALYPQLGLQGDTPVYFQLGASDIVGSEPLWGTLQSYDPTTDNKIDGREAGRYLAWRMYYSGLHDFALSGFDAKVTIRGRR